MLYEHYSHYPRGTMRIPIPGKKGHIRVFEPVKTVDTQYHIFDTGYERPDGRVDSIAVGGAFATATDIVNNMNAAADKQTEIHDIQMQIDCDEYAVNHDLPFINLDGTPVPPEQQRTTDVIVAA